MPTFLAFKKGEKIGELTGAVPAKLKVCAIVTVDFSGTDKLLPSYRLCSSRLRLPHKGGDSENVMLAIGDLI